MHFLALAVDYDGTLAENGYVAEQTCQALRRLKDSGRKLLLVTGRELVDLRHAFPELGLFDRIVAENGALLYDPARDQEKMLAPPASSALLDRLAADNVKPLSVGRSIIASWHPHEQAILNAIHDLGLELQIIFNKDAIMVLPSNVNKASGLLQALKELDISPLNVVGAGDAENDHAFLAACGCSAAVANALPSLKEAADLKLQGDHGKGSSSWSSGSSKRTAGYCRLPGAACSPAWTATGRRCIWSRTTWCCSPAIPAAASPATSRCSPSAWSTRDWNSA